MFALPSEKEGFGIVFLEALRFWLLVDPDLPLAPHLRALLERRGPQLCFDPVGLSAAVVERFAFAAFCRRLDQLLTAEAELTTAQ